MDAVLVILYYLALAITTIVTLWFWIAVFAFSTGKTTQYDMKMAQQTVMFTSLAFMLLATVYSVLRLNGRVLSSLWALLGF